MRPAADACPGTCLDIPRPPPGRLAHARSPTRNSVAFARLRSFCSRAFLHNVRARRRRRSSLFAPPSPPPSVKPRLYPYTSLFSAPPVLSSSLTNHNTRISVAHIVMPALIPAYGVAQARCILWLGSLLVAQTPLCWQLLLASSSTNTKYARSPPDVLWVMRP